MAERQSMAFKYFGAGVVSAVIVIGVVSGLGATAASAQMLPEIRMHERNRVPACVTPERLNGFLASGNSSVKPQFRDIAKHYKTHGERLKIRWDYAFYQMILETNYLKFVNNAGQGDVKPAQNNFAGIGTTGGGVPGDSFPDVSTGVLGQMQHLIAYSGERVENPVARRTREKQDEIIQKSKALGRPVTFKDLTKRWAADGRYGASITFVAGRFTSQFCNGRQTEDAVAEAVAADVQPEAEADEPKQKGGKRGRDSKRRSLEAEKQGKAGKAKLAQKPVVTEEEIDDKAPADEKVEEAAEKPRGAAIASRAIAEGKAAGDEKRRGLITTTTASLLTPPAPAMRPTACAVQTASYGGRKNVLIRVLQGGEMKYTALQVIEGQEETLAASFIKTHAAGGELVGKFVNRDEALMKAFDLCPSASGR